MIQEKYRKKYLDLILKTTYHKDLYVVKMGFISLRDWTNVDKIVIGEICSEAIKDMKECSIWRTALETLSITCADGGIDHIVSDLFRHLLEKSYECEKNYYNAISNLKDNNKLENKEEHTTERIERDMAARQRLIALSNKVLSLKFTTKIKLKNKLFKDITSILSISGHQNQSMAYIKSRFYIGFIDWRCDDDIIRQLKSIEQIIQMRPYIMMDVCEEITANINSNKDFINMNILLEISEKLLEQTFELQFIGLAFLQVCGSKLNWNKESVMILNKYRNSDYDEIKYRAFDIWIVCE